jgi:uncharacterized membrane protein YhaH (DUF805 family)
MAAFALISSAGRISRGTFTLAIVAVYVSSFLSQLLLVEPVLHRLGPWPFALAQAVLIWAWYVLHARRLRDAGHGSGMAIGIAIVYTLAIVLLILIVTATTPSATPSPPAQTPQSQDSSNLLGFVLILYLLALFTHDPSLGIFGYVLMAVALLLLTPIVIAFGFSIHTALRKRVPAAALAVTQATPVGP